MSTPTNHDNAYYNNNPLYPAMTAEGFANLGAPDLAYVRPVHMPEGDGWGIFSANGTQLGWAPARDLAFAAAVQNDLIPVSLH